MGLAFIYLKGQSVLAPLVTFQLPTTLPSPNIKEENECYLHRDRLHLLAQFPVIPGPLSQQAL